jgi:23S rRNA (adenine2030-N6)-methyltransferase
VNYRHGYHAGNFADVVKHVALVAVLQHLRKKETAFAVIDSHAGRGLYDLSGIEAAKTGEAQNGIARLRGLTGEMPPALATYLAIVAESGTDKYPGSPLIAAKLLRPQDRLTAIEKHPEEAAALKGVLSPFANAAVESADGYSRMVKLLPPPARRGVILVDPPFEAPDEFTALANRMRAAHRRFATGIFLIWYPIKTQSVADSFTGEALSGGADRALTIEIAMAAEPGRLGKAGLLVINPPYGFRGEMAAALVLAAPLLQAETRLIPHGD